FSSFGSYTGNGSADGSFIYTGFRPAYVLIKNTNAAFNWILHDTARDPDNLAEHVFFSDTHDAESVELTYTSLDILSNGFKLRASHQFVNYSGYNYIYMAFAENPFKYSNAR
ncbi:MAG TPA: hypothetical protein VMW91_05060, partial [Desulfosporosinus sp.]|nr:hypothetical protein [Desulfosporosinus sp.]